MALSLDLASKDRPDGIQYRVGLHQVFVVFKCNPKGKPGHADCYTFPSPSDKLLHVYQRVMVFGLSAFCAAAGCHPMKNQHLLAV